MCSRNYDVSRSVNRRRAMAGHLMEVNPGLPQRIAVLVMVNLVGHNLRGPVCLSGPTCCGMLSTTACLSKTIGYLLLGEVCVVAGEAFEHAAAWLRAAAPSAGG